MIKRHHLLIIAAILAIGSTLTGAIYLENTEEQRLLQERRSQVLQHLSYVRAKLEGMINSTLFLTRGIVAYVATHPEISEREFHGLAKELLLEDTHIRNIGLAKDNVITHMYPIEGNEAAIGLRYMDNPAQRDAVIRAIETKKTVVAGPVNLVQGGRGFISRTPVFLTPPESEPGSGDYWGIVSMVINADAILEEAEIESSPLKMKIAMRGKDGLGAGGDSFYGERDVFTSDPILLDINLPDGSWQIGAIPVEGWHAPSDTVSALRLAALLVSVLLGTSIWLYARLSEEKIKSRIEESERDFRAIFDNMQDTFYRTDRDGLITMVSPSATKLMGYNPQELIGKNLAGLYVHPDDRLEFLKKMDENGGSIIGQETYLRRKDGEHIWVSTNAHYWKNKDGSIGGIEGITRDITKRKNLLTSLLQLKTALDTINVGITITDTDGKIIYSNPAEAKMHGYTLEEITGKDVGIFAPASMRQPFYPKASETLQTKRRETINITKYGKLFPVYLVSDTVVNSDNEVVGMVTVSEDLSERKETEDKLKKYAKILSKSAEHISFVDCNYVYQTVNEAYLKAHNRKREEITGQPVDSLLGEKKFKENVKEKLDLALSGKEVRYESWFDFSGTGKRYMDVNYYPYHDDKGIISGVFVHARDITERKLAEEEIKSSEEQLRHLTAAIQSGREEERNKISLEVHDELGQLLTAIKIDLSLMKNDIPPGIIELEERYGYIMEMVNSTIKSVKRISRDLRPETIDNLGLEAAIKSHIKEFEDRSPIDCHLKITASCEHLSKDTSLAVFRIFQEAMTNILRHSSASRTRITLGSCNKGKDFLVKISDNGIGIGRETLKNTMSVGIRGMKERARNEGGRLLMRGMKGRGTTVALYLPGKGGINA